MQLHAERMRRDGKVIAYCPLTMDIFMRGTLNLMREGRKRSDCLVVSIYVNPTSLALKKISIATPVISNAYHRLAEGVEST
jgi:pantothenate synthetase